MISITKIFRDDINISIDLIDIRRFRIFSLSSSQVDLPISQRK